MYIDRVQNQSPVQVSSYVGRRWPLHTAAVGKALVAFVRAPALEHSPRR